MIYTYSNDAIGVDKTKKYIEIEPSSVDRLNFFLEELKLINLSTCLDLNPFANPNKNYEIFISILTKTKQRILPK